MKYLIVNADDFGYSYSVNKGIIEAHTKGILTSTSVLVDSIAAHEAKDLNKFNDLSIGLHFWIEEIKNVKVELEKQVKTFISIVGREPDHIDTHKRDPNSEGIRLILEEYSKVHRIPIRNLGYAKFIDSFFGSHSNGDVSVARLKKAIDEATDEYNEIMCHVGYSDDYLREHSSYSDPREEELASLCDPEIRQYIKDKGIKLVSWNALRNRK